MSRPVYGGVHQMRRHLVLVVAAVSLLLACSGEGGQAPAPGKSPATEAPPAGPGPAAPPPAAEPGKPGTAPRQLSLARPAEAEGPRMAELVLRHGPGLRFSAAEPLEATTRAGKQLVAQERSGSRLRLVLFAGTNLARLDSGPLARLTFERTGDGPETLEVLYGESAFAPAALYPRPETLELAPEGTP